MFYYLVVFPPCLTQPLSTSLMFCWVVGQLLPLGVGWQDCQSFSHMPTPPTTAFTPLYHCYASSRFPVRSPLWSIHPRAHREVSFCSSCWSTHSHAEEDGLVSSSRTSSDSAGSHTAERGVAYQWSFMCFHRVESGMFSPVWWLLIRFWDCCFPMP